MNAQPAISFATVTAKTFGGSLEVRLSKNVHMTARMKNIPTITSVRRNMSTETKLFNPAGWLLCPRCGEDEVWSRLMRDWNGNGDAPTNEECFAEEMGCYRCGWNSVRSAQINRAEIDLYFQRHGIARPQSE
jgi:hypothetical protein